MYIWVAQSERPSRKARTVERTRYLEPMRGVLERAIRDYFDRDPRGEQVTLACLASVGRSRALRIARRNARTLDAVKQDLGLYVAILLGDIFHPDEVETYRDAKTLRNATRSRSKSRRSDLGWVSKYTPHRLRRDPRAARGVRRVSRENDRDALRFWLDQTPRARINAMEFLRRQVHLVTGEKSLPVFARSIRLRSFGA